MDSCTCACLCKNAKHAVVGRTWSTLLPDMISMILAPWQRPAIKAKYTKVAFEMPMVKA